MLIVQGKVLSKHKAQTTKVVDMVFYKSLPWLFNRNMLLKKRQMLQYLFIAILCAKILCVKRALEYMQKHIRIFSVNIISNLQ